MKFPPTGRLAFLLPAILMILRPAGAEETTATPPADDQALRKISGIFDTDLPKTEKKGRVRFLVHPHLGDFTRRPYVRVPFGVR